MSPHHTPAERAKRRQNVGRKPAKKTLPARASATARARAFGQRGLAKRRVRNPGGFGPGNIRRRT